MDVHWRFTPGFSLKLNRNILRKEALGTFSITSAPLLGVPIALHRAYKESRADRTSQLGVSDSDSCDKPSIQLYDALHLLSTEIYPTWL